VAPRSDPAETGGLRRPQPQQPGGAPAGGGGVRPDTGCACGVVRPVWVQIAAEPMTTPDQTPDTELEVQELTDENLEGVSGGTRAYLGVIGDLEGVDLTNDVWQGVTANFDLG
jgi:hypothetical protein